MGDPAVKIEIRDLHVAYRGAEAVLGVSLDILANQILAVIGPSNSGKSTLLQAINRMLDRVPHASVRGDIRLDGRDVRSFREVEELRRRIGMVYAVPTPLPMSIRENVLFGPRLQRRLDGASSDRIVESSLRSAFLWDEVKQRLDDSALRQAHSVLGQLRQRLKEPLSGNRDAAE